jgi:hypothetical protein
MESDPHDGVGVAMHNMYLPMCELVGKDNVKWVCDEFYRSDDNPIYKLTRYE